MKEASGNYFYNPKIKTNSNDGDGFYSAGTATDEYIDSEKADKIYHGEWDIEDDEEEYSPMYDNYEERQVDMLSLPVYWYVVFAIPADLSFGSATARQIDAFQGLRDKLEKAVEKYEDEC